MQVVSKIAGAVKRNRLTLVGVLAGIVGGFLYWRLVGCSGGSCPITSSPLASSAWGAAMGGLLFSAFEKEKK